jgi:hypothetical protein
VSDIVCLTHLERIKVLEAEVERLRDALRRVAALSNGIIKRYQGGYVGDRDDTKEILAIARAALPTEEPRFGPHSEIDDQVSL